MFIHQLSHRQAATGESDTVDILLVEDDMAIAQDIIGSLGMRGYTVHHAADGLEGLALAAGGGFAAMVVDRMMPKLDGLTLVKALRERNIDVPVLILSAMGDSQNRVAGLIGGADDYLPKPFAMDELAARLGALLRRSGKHEETRLVAGPLVLDLIRRTAQRNGHDIELLPKEFELLEYLMRNYKRLVTRDMLLRDVWHYNFAAATNVVDVHMGKLRRKLSGPQDPPLIHNLRGKGFILSADIEA